MPEAAGRWLKRDLPNPDYWTLTVALGIFMSARVVELVRSGVRSLPRDQLEASRTLGLSQYGAYRKVILPQVARIVFPPLTTEFTNCFKATSVGLTIGYVEVTQRAREISEQTLRTFEIFLIATLFYALSILVITVTLQVIEHAIRIPVSAGPRRSSASKAATVTLPT